MIKHTTILSVLLLLGVVNSKAQNLKGNVGLEDSHKPNASKGGGGRNIVNVDPYTGTGSVNIPIYDFAVDDIESNVSLSYSAKGIRVDERSSSVGLGWELNAGGKIVRQVYGLEDEITLPAQFKNTSDYLQGLIAAGATVDPQASRPDDLESDLFIVNLGGTSFSFSFKIENGSPVVVTSNSNKYTVEPIFYNYNPTTGAETVTTQTSNTVSDSLNRLLKFTIYDEKGNIFYFTRGDYQHKTFEFDEAQFTPHKGVYYTTNTWNLVKVKTYTGKEIHYSYVRKYVEFEESATEVMYPRNHSYEYDANNNPIAVINDPLEIKYNLWKGIKTHIASIAYPNGMAVNFNLTLPSIEKRCDCEGDFMLKAINVKGNDDYHEKTISFVLKQGFFVTPAYGNTAIEASLISNCNDLISYTGSDASAIKAKYLSRGFRLKLKSIERHSYINGNTLNAYTEPYYSFTYNSTPLPFRFSSKKDYYGYYNNGQTVPFTRSALLPGYPTSYDLSIPYDWNNQWGQYREYNFTYAQAFVLEKIKNRTGGEIVIGYTNYTLNNPDSAYSNAQPVIGGGGGTVYTRDPDPELEGTTENDGLVVGAIEYRNFYDNLTTTTTQYIYEGGQRFHQGGFTKYRDRQDNFVYTNYFVGSNQYLRGSNHGFSTVQIREFGHNNELLSTTKYSFTNLVYYENGIKQTNLVTNTVGLYTNMLPCRLNTYRMGLPLKMEVLNSSGDVLSETSYSYEYVSNGPSVTNTKSYTAIYQNPPNGFYSVTENWPYEIVDNKQMRLSQKTERIYRGSSGALLEKVYNYQYDHNNNPKKTTWIDSKGTLFSRFTRYNYDFPATGALAVMSGKQFALIDEMWKWAGNDSQLVSMTVSAPSVTALGLGSPIQMSLKSANPVPAATANNTTYLNRLKALSYPTQDSFGLMLIKDMEVTKYNPKGAAVEVELANGNKLFSYIYDEHTGSKLAEVANARYDDIAYSSFESWPGGNWDYGTQVFYNDAAAVAAGVTKAVTGNMILDITRSQCTSNPLRHKKYLLTFWHYSGGGAAPVVRLVNGSNFTSVTCTQRNSVNGWKLYSAIIEPDSGWQVMIRHISFPTGGGIPYVPSPPEYAFIDEVRLHPVDASMKSYTYSPFNEMTSVNDASNNIIYFEMDEMERLNITRDLRGNVLEKVETKYQKNDAPSTGGGGNDPNDPDNG